MRPRHTRDMRPKEVPRSRRIESCLLPRVQVYMFKLQPSDEPAMRTWISAVSGLLSA